MGKKKGKGKKVEDGSGDQVSQASSSGAVPPQQSQPTAAGNGRAQPQVTQVGSPSPPVTPQQPPSQPVAESQPQQQQQQQQQQQGKKKGKQQPGQQQSKPAPVVEQPSLPKPQSQPADVASTQAPGQGQGQGKRKGKKQQEIQEPPGPPPKHRPATAPEPSAAASQQPQGAWGRGKTSPPQQQQQQPGGRGQTPPQQQAAGRGQAPPQQQAAGRGQAPPQQQPGGRGQAPGVRGQTPPQQQPGGRGQTPPPQQQAGGRGQTPPPQQQPAGPWGRGQTQPPQQQPGGPQGRTQGPQQQGRGAGRGPAAGPTQVPGASQPLEKSMQQLQIGDQPQKQQSQARAPPLAKQAPKVFELAIPRRPDIRKGGTRGQAFTVETNHLALDINPRYETAVHYDVAIDPDRPKKMMRPVWEEFKRQYLPKFAIAFDDVRNAYSPTRMKDDIAGEVQVAEDEFAKPKTYKVVVKYAAEVNLRALFTYMQSGGRTAVPQEALQCIDIVLRNASAVRFVRVGRSYFSPPRGQIVSLGDGLELWHGFFQSAVIGWKPFLNVDVAHKGFPKPQPVIALFAEMSAQSQYRERGDGQPLNLSAEDIDKISKFMKSLKIQYEIRGQPASRKCYRVNSLAQIPGRAMFVHNGVQISVLDYFKNEKNYNIAHPQLPCLWVGPRDRKIYLPAELCTIVAGQVFNRKLNEIQTSQMVRNAATNSIVRKEKIINSVQNVNFNNDPIVRAFGLQIGADFEKINARLLEPPALEYGLQKQVRPSKGVWRADKFLAPQALPPGSWTIINLDRRTRDDSLSNFARLLQQNSQQLGMTIAPPDQPFIRQERFDQRQFEETLRKLKSKRMIFVVVPDFPTNIYGKVKHAAEVKIGCLTQCIKSKTMFKMNPATVGNILLKVNAKLNGHNHTIANSYRPSCLLKPCMIMGADVTHPSPDQTDIPSVAAVTASCDPRAFQYTFSWRLQDPRQEIITDLERIVHEQLLFYYRQSKLQPQRIIFFRDGVSEGQFQEVMNMEVQAIRRACSRLGTPGSYKPAITFLVVQKRHHTRFFPTKRHESDDRNFNVRAGTVVDTDITHPTDLEYYLVSHASIQGVARPTKYRVLWDDSNMSEDELEALTYYLCHMFSRCTRSVSYPAPTYYAHLAAFRARVYLEGYRVNLDNLPQEQENLKIKDEILRGLPMFFV